MDKVNERKLAVKLLTAITYQKAFLNDELRKLDGMETPVRAYVQRVVRGVIENQLYLDAFIQSESRIRLAKMRDKDLNILRLALYEMLFMDSIPRYATVNEAIRLMKRSNAQLVRYANGLLRNFSSHLETLKERFDGDLSPSVRYSHPQWLVDLYEREYGADVLEEILTANNAQPGLSLRVNTLKATRGDVLSQLTEAGFVVEPSLFSPDGILHHGQDGSDLFAHPLFKGGVITVQDQSSMLVAPILDPKPGQAVLDMCSAPGGKTGHIAQLMANQGTLEARDVSYEKLYRVRENLDRLGVTCAHLEVADARVHDPSLDDGFDRVLLDAPCSGLGIIRRKPDIRWQRQAEDLKELASIQAEMLENASKYVKIGGVVVYSTCTMASIENEGVIEAFLELHPGYQRCEITGVDPRLIRNGYLKVMPHLHHMDGFFAAKLRRTR